MYMNLQKQENQIKPKIHSLNGEQKALNGKRSVQRCFKEYAKTLNKREKMKEVEKNRREQQMRRGMIKKEEEVWKLRGSMESKRMHENEAEE